MQECFTDEGGFIVTKRLNYFKTWASACQRVMQECADYVLLVLCRLSGLGVMSASTLHASWDPSAWTSE